MIRKSTVGVATLLILTVLNRYDHTFAQVAPVKQYPIEKNSIPIPVIKPNTGPIILYLDSLGNYTVILSDVATVTGNDTVTVTPDSFNCSTVGEQIVTVTVTNRTVLAQLQIPVTVSSSLIFTTPYSNATIPILGTCPAIIPDYTITARATGNCGKNIVFDQSPSPGTQLVNGVPVTVFVSAFDGTKTTVVSFVLTAVKFAAGQPSISIAPSTNPICGNMPVTFTATTANAGSNPSYQWQVNSVNKGTDSPVFTSSSLSNADVVTCTLQVNSGCFIPVTSLPVTIIVNPTPTVSFNTDNVFIDIGGNTKLNPIVSGNIAAFSWTPITGLSNPNIQDPIASPLSSTKYNLHVTAIDGCGADGAVIVNLLNALIIPNAFTPNNDGINDKWEINGLGNYLGCTVTIYNRFGSVVYKSTGYAKSWDGRLNGNPLPIGTYYYIIDTNNGGRLLTGYVTILR